MPAKSIITNDPFTKIVAVTKSDSTVYDPPLRGLWIGGAGNVAIVAFGDTDPQVLAGASAGQIIPGMISKVMSTDTTTTLMKGFR